VNEVLRRLGDVTLALGDPETARSHGLRALEVSQRLGDLLERAACERLLGMCAWRLGHMEAAEPHLATAVSLFAAASERFELGRTHLAAGRLFREKWARDPARGEWRDRALGHLGSSAEALSSLEGTPELALPLLELAELRLAIGLVDEAAADVLRAAGLVDPVKDPVLAEAVDGVRRGVEGTIAQAPSEELPFGDSRELTGTDDGAGFEQLLRNLVARTRCDRAALLSGSLTSGPALEAVSIEGFLVADARRAATLLAACEPSLADGRPLLCLDVRSDSRLRPIAGTPFDGTASVLAIPLGPPGGPEGLLYLDRARGNVAGPFRRSEFHLAQTMAQLAWFGLVERQRRRLVRENRDLRDRLRGASEHFRDVVTQNPVMHETLRIVQRVGESDASVLLQGETGTGKGLIAEAIHRSSPRRDRPFVTINCAALPEGLLESELFGHVAGSFTGAVRDKRGLFEEAAGGTLFLDEVDKTSRTVQGKLLHVLDKREVRAVGSNRWVSVDVRVICATNAELMSCIQAGAFLEDLYYRLNDFVIRVPPLRERREDIPLLVEHFLDVFSRQLGKKPRGLTQGVLQRLMDHPWRGNVRELQKTVRRLVVLVDDGELIDEGLLPPEILASGGDDGDASGKTLREEIGRLEARMIREALESTGWNRSEVARRLRVSYPALLSKIRIHKIERRRR
jgi:DNA-binding NtrC family response regulator